MAEINTWPGWNCVRLLGRGSFGKVYEIERMDNGVRRRSALKVMSFPMNPSDVQTGFIEGWYSDEMGARTFYESQINTFSREYRLMQAISNHENIVTFEDYMVVPHQGWVGADILIRMELLTPLSQWLVYNPINDEVITRLGINISGALETCQKLKPPILHRDIKLDNIMVDEFGNFKLGDFGVARFMEETKSAHTVAGTESYMAPEVVMGKGYTVTADIYSLGIVLYRLLNNGRNPFLPTEGPLTYEVQENSKIKRLNGTVVPPPQYGSERLKKIIRKCLEYNPSDRYKKASDLKNAFERLYEGKSDNDFGIKKSSTITGLKVTMYSILGFLALVGVLFCILIFDSCRTVWSERSSQSASVSTNETTPNPDNTNGEKEESNDIKPETSVNDSTGHAEEYENTIVDLKIQTSSNMILVGDTVNINLLNGEDTIVDTDEISWTITSTSANEDKEMIFEIENGAITAVEAGVVNLTAEYSGYHANVTLSSIDPNKAYVIDVVPEVSDLNTVEVDGSGTIKTVLYGDVPDKLDFRIYYTEDLELCPLVWEYDATEKSLYFTVDGEVEDTTEGDISIIILDPDSLWQVLGVGRFHVKID